MGKLAEAIEREFGFPVRVEFMPKHEELSVTAEQVLKENPDRISWDIFNLGTEVVYLSHDEVPTSTHGFYLDKNGGHIGQVWNEDGEEVGFPLWAVAAAGTPTIFLKAVEGA